MDTHDTPKLPTTDSLPRPVVLKPEDLAAVAAAGAGMLAVSAMAALPSMPVIRAGGMPVANVMVM